MVILITGITGYLGSQLARVLAQDHIVLGCIRTSSSLKRLQEIENLMLFNIDKNEWLDNVFEYKPQIIINTATLYGRKNESLSDLVNANIVFPLSLLERAASESVAAFINCGTSLPSDVSHYAMTKNQFVELGLALSKSIKFIDLRLEHFFGAFDDESKFTSYVIGSCIKNIDLNLTEGLQKRDFIYIMDLVSAFKVILKNIDFLQTGELISVGSGNAITIRDFVEIVVKVSKYSGKVNYGVIPEREHELMFSCADVAKLISLGWTKKFDVTTGVNEILDKEY